MLTSLRAKPYYRWILWAGSLACLAFVMIQGMRAVTAPTWIFADDYVEYWAAGRLNFTGGNPYDPEQLLPLQLQAGRYFGVPVIMWNPPGMLALAMPFGILGYAFSRTLWLLLFFFIVLLCVSEVWRLYGGLPQRLWISWLVGFTFIPALDALKTGQTGPLLFLGVVGFLSSIRRGNAWFAGAFLALLAVKPHILYLYSITVAVWVVERRQWKVLLGIAGALVGSTAIAWMVNPNVISHYFYALSTYPPEDWATPTVGGFLRLLFGIDQFWMQFIAPVLGITWFIFYWMRNRRTWDWIEQSPLLILVSIATAAYGWTSDQTVSLVAILQIAVIIMLTPWRSSNLKIIIAFIVIDFIVLVARINQIFFFWLAPALLIWYLSSMKILKKRTLAEQPMIPETEIIPSE